uniref:Methyltransf_25 domain-containing protein n=1 Tax=Rhabditophanes sp. KR3021 TaxID=114890 RepID=A0AC35UDE8_9BILA
MRKIVKNVFSAHINDIALQLASPIKSFSGNLITKYVARGSQDLHDLALKQFTPQNNHNYLEIGFGNGDALSKFHNRILENSVDARLFGIEASQYAVDKAYHKFAIESEDGQIVIEHSSQLAYLPFPNNFFEGIYHIDLFYYLSDALIPKIEREVWRILKPGGKLVCTLDLNRLKKWEEWGILKEKDYDVMRYLEYLEPCGLTNIKVEYQKVGNNNRELMLITATKPKACQQDDDPEAKFKQLEMDIKHYLLEEALLKNKAHKIVDSSRE